MSNEMLLAGLLCVAQGVVLSFAPTRALFPSLAVALTCTAAGAELSEAMQHLAIVGCALSILATALASYLKVSFDKALLLSANAGFWCGALTEIMSGQTPFLALPLLLTAVPGRWIISRGAGIALKVLSGWLVAVGLLAAALPIITTPGYEPDHME